MKRVCLEYPKEGNRDGTCLQGSNSEADWISNAGLAMEGLVGVKKDARFSWRMIEPLNKSWF